MATVFSSSERDLIRREFSQRFGQEPVVAEGMFLRIWRSGPQKGQPKIPAAMQSLVERGLVQIRPIHTTGARAYFTEAGLTALRELLSDRRAINPEQFAHLHRELAVNNDP